MKQAGIDINDLKPEMRKASTVLGNTLRRETPKKSGRMASTIREGTAARKASVKIGRNPMKYRYVNRLNYGKRSPYRLFIQRATEKARRPVLAAMENGINAVLRRNNL